MSDKKLWNEFVALEKERDALRAELDALKSREGEVVYRWLALDYSGFCYGSNPPDNLPNRCNLKAFYAPAEVAPVSQINFEDDTLDASDGVTKLLLAAEHWKKKATTRRAKIAGLVPVGLLHVGSYYGEELQDWEFEADQQACDRLNEEHFQKECSLKLYALPGAQPAPSVPDGWKEGVESAARLIDQKAELYAIRFGRDDLGGLSFGTGPHAEIKMDHYTNLIELADEVRATLAASLKPEAKP